MACILVASLAVNAVGVGIRQIWPLVASLGYGLTTRDIGEMFSLRMFSIVLMVALGGVVQSAAPPRVVVAVASAVLTVVCVLWSLPPAVLSPFVFKALMLLAGGISSLTFVNLNALVQLVDRTRQSAINAAYRSVIMVAALAVPAAAVYFDIGAASVSSLVVRGEAAEAALGYPDAAASDGAAAEWPHPHAVARSAALSQVFACVGALCAVTCLLFVASHPRGHATGAKAGDASEGGGGGAGDASEGGGGAAAAGPAAAPPPPPPAPAAPSSSAASGPGGTGLRRRAAANGAEPHAAAAPTIVHKELAAQLEAHGGTPRPQPGFVTAVFPKPLIYHLAIATVAMSMDEASCTYASWRMTHPTELGESPAFLGVASTCSAVLCFVLIVACGRAIDDVVSLKRAVLLINIARAGALLCMGLADQLVVPGDADSKRRAAMLFAVAWAVHDASFHAYAAPSSMWLGRGVVSYHEAQARGTGATVTDASRAGVLAKGFVVDKVASCVIRGAAIHAFSVLVRSSLSISTLFLCCGAVSALAVVAFATGVDEPPVPGRGR